MTDAEYERIVDEFFREKRGETKDDTAALMAVIKKYEGVVERLERVTAMQKERIGSLEEAVEEWRAIARAYWSTFAALRKANVP